MPKVTALRNERPGRALVELDGAAWRTLPLDVVARVGLVVGLELDRSRLRSLRRELRRQEALDVAGHALRRRDRPSAELGERLARRGVPPAARAEALETLERSGLVDDGRYALRRAGALAERGAGDALIRWQLERDGLAREPIEAALASIDPEAERAARVVSRSRDPARAARSLARKGFSQDTIEAAFPSVVAEDGSAAVRYAD
jgi:regulatory protein